MKSRKVIYILSLIVGLSTVSCSSKKGCTDPNALNYKDKAKIDDSSCEYANTFASLKLITTLKSLFNETSGLEFIQGNVWTFGDSGNPATIWTIDTGNGNYNELITFTGGVNVDWEDISADSSHIYIGDIGNGYGDRVDQAIYIIPIIDTSVLKKNNKTDFDLIHYSYPDQTDFRKNSLNNYDAEALVYIDNFIYIFTKRHGDLHTHLYQIPSQQGIYIANLLGRFDSKGVITGADISPDKKTMVLTGFNPISNHAFLWVFRDVKTSSLFDNKKIYVDLGLRTNPNVGQIEAVVFVNNDSILLSNENYKNIPPSLYGLNISAIK